jgi:ribosomal protein S18 acetylase RimI-like enzyme
MMVDGDTGTAEGTESGGGPVEVREAEAEDWPAIAGQLGRPAADGAALRRQVQQGYDPLLAYVGVVPADVRADGRAGGPDTGSGGLEIAGAVVAGVARGAAPNGAGDAERTGRLLWVGVAPGHRRRGLGSRLVEHALDGMRSRQIKRAALLVDGRQVEAIALFRRLGFETDGQDLGLLLDTEAAAALAGKPGPPPAAGVRPLSLDDVPLLAGLLIRLGLERAEAPHDSLNALTPAQVEHWLQQPATVAFGAWERGDPNTPLGIAWATRRAGDGVLHFIGVADEHRRQGIGTALLAAVAGGLARSERPSGSAAEPAGRASAASGSDAGRFRPLRAELAEPGDEQGFFRKHGFTAERVTLRLSRAL